MTGSEGTGSRGGAGGPEDEGLTLPSWIDEAIAKSKTPNGDTPDVTGPDAPPEALPEQPTEPYDEEAPAPHGPPSGREPFPSFLKGRGAPETQPEPQPIFKPEVVSHLMPQQEEPPRPGPEPITFATGSPRRRPALPWVFAALFFATAALVLGLLIWLRPPQPQ